MAVVLVISVSCVASWAVLNPKAVRKLIPILWALGLASRARQGGQLLHQLIRSEAQAEGMSRQQWPTYKNFSPLVQKAQEFTKTYGPLPTQSLRSLVGFLESDLKEEKKMEDIKLGGLVQIMATLLVILGFQYFLSQKLNSQAPVQAIVVAHLGLLGLGAWGVEALYKKIMAPYDLFLGVLFRLDFFCGLNLSNREVYDWSELQELLNFPFGPNSHLGALKENLARAWRDWRDLGGPLTSHIEGLRFQVMALREGKLGFFRRLASFLFFFLAALGAIPSFFSIVSGLMGGLSPLWGP